MYGVDSNAAKALLTLQEGVLRVQSTVRGAFYGIRLAGKRLGDLTAKGGPLAMAVKTSAEEMKKLTQSLERPDEDLSETAVLAYYAHFGEFLHALSGKAAMPGQPESTAQVEELLGRGAIFKKEEALFSLFLALAGVAVRGGTLDKRALKALGRDEVELNFSMGKVLLFMEGDRVSLTDKNLEAMGGAIIEAAQKIRAKYP